MDGEPAWVGSVGWGKSDNPRVGILVADGPRGGALPQCQLSASTVKFHHTTSHHVQFASFVRVRPLTQKLFLPLRSTIMVASIAAYTLHSMRSFKYPGCPQRLVQDGRKALVRRSYDR